MMPLPGQFPVCPGCGRPLAAQSHASDCSLQVTPEQRAENLALSAGLERKQSSKGRRTDWAQSPELAIRRAQATESLLQGEAVEITSAADFDRALGATPADSLDAPTLAEAFRRTAYSVAYDSEAIDTIAADIAAEYDRLRTGSMAMPLASRPLASGYEVRVKWDDAAIRRAYTEPTPPLRYMPDGTPCWCVSADEPHEGWAHAPACTATALSRLEAAGASSTPDPISDAERAENVALTSAFERREQQQ
jgi:hypothetical protein